MGNDVTTFWLQEGGAVLKISPIEQVQFLKKIYRKKFALSPKTYETLQDIMLREEASTYKLYAKTGAATINWKGHGWYVGYVVSKGKAWFFVTNILIKNMGDLPKRIQITMDALRKKSII